MKKVMFILCTMLFFVSFGAVAMQEVVPDPDPGGSFGDYVETFAALVAVIPVVTEIFRTKFNVGGVALQVISWSLGVVIALGSFYLHLGIFDEVLLWQALVIGAAASLAANGVADTGLIQTILNLIPGINVKKKKTVEVTE